MNVLDNLFDKAMAKYSRPERRIIKRRIEGVGHKKPRSSRRCVVCHEVTPTYNLVTVPVRGKLCKGCRDAELRGEVK